MKNLLEFTETLIDSIGIEKAIETICHLDNEEIKSLIHYGN